MKHRELLLNATHPCPIWLLSVVLLALPGCGSDTSTPDAAAPEVVSFEATPDRVSLGQVSVLSWSVEDADSVNITDGERSWTDQPPASSLDVVPEVSTSYILEATGPGGKSRSTVTVTVDTLATPVAPVIQNFSVEPTSIEPGASAKLQWNVLGATALTLSWGDNSLEIETLESGEHEVAPEDTTIYSLEAEGPGGSTLKELTLTVRRPTIHSFTADPTDAREGQEIILSWETEFADTLTLSPPVGADNLEANGSLRITPAVGLHSYTLRAASEGLSAEASVDVQVHGEPVIERFEFVPARSLPGQPVELIWVTSGAERVELEPSPSEQFDGSIVNNESNPLLFLAEETQTYRLTAFGVGGTAESAIELIVDQRPVVVTFDSEPASISLGQSAALRWRVDHADEVRITPIDTPDSPARLPEGSIEVSPETTTSYQLSATGSGGQVQAIYELEVHPPPTIHSFLGAFAGGEPGSDLSIPRREPVSLSWTTSNTTEVSLTLCDHELSACEPAPLNFPVAQVNGSYQVQPVSNLAYVLVAIGPGGEVSSEPVRVTILPEPEVLSFEIEPLIGRIREDGDPEIPRGAAVRISWTTAHADEVVIEPGVGVDELPANGSVEHAPNGTVRYTLTAVGAGGLASSQRRVVVLDNPEIRLEPASQEIALGGEATLSWEVTGAVSIEFQPALDPPVDPQEFTGERSVQPEQSTEYTLRAVNGADGEVTATATVTVNQPPTAVSFAADDAEILIGGSTVLRWEIRDANAYRIRATDQDGVFEDLDLLGQGPEEGFLTVSPSADTSYDLYAEGPGGGDIDGEALAQTSVGVRPAPLRISEVFYDAGDTDTGYEWLELYNPGPDEVPLDGYWTSLGFVNWTSPGAQALEGSIEAGGCIVIGGPLSEPINGSPVFDLPVDGYALLQDRPGSSNAVGIFFRPPGGLIFNNNTLDLVPLDAFLFGISNIQGFLGPDGEEAPVHFDLFERDEDGNYIRVEGQRISRVQPGQSLARVNPDTDEWVVNESPSPGSCFELAEE